MTAPHLPTDAPSRSHETAPFWDALDEGRFVLPRCEACGHVVWYPRQFCPVCHTMGVSWFEASGRGTIYSFTVTRQAYGEWRDAAPYVIAYVELEEGPRLLTNVVGCDPDALAIGDEVTLVIDRAPEGGAVYRFSPA